MFSKQEWKWWDFYIFRGNDPWKNSPLKKQNASKCQRVPKGWYFQQISVLEVSSSIHCWVATCRNGRCALKDFRRAGKQKKKISRPKPLRELQWCHMKIWNMSVFCVLFFFWKSMCLEFQRVPQFATWTWNQHLSWSSDRSPRISLMARERKQG